MVVDVMKQKKTQTRVIMLGVLALLALGLLLTSPALAVRWCAYNNCNGRCCCDSVEHSYHGCNRAFPPNHCEDCSHAGTCDDAHPSGCDGNTVVLLGHQSYCNNWCTKGKACTGQESKTWTDYCDTTGVGRNTKIGWWDWTNDGNEGSVTRTCNKQCEGAGDCKCTPTTPNKAFHDCGEDHSNFPDYCNTVGTRQWCDREGPDRTGRIQWDTMTVYCKKTCRGEGNTITCNDCTISDPGCGTETDVTGPNDTAYCDNCNKPPLITSGPTVTFAGGTITVSASVSDQDSDRLILIVKDATTGDELCRSDPTALGALNPISLACHYNQDPCVSGNVEVYAREYIDSEYKSCNVSNSAPSTLSIDCPCTSDAECGKNTASFNDYCIQDEREWCDLNYDSNWNDLTVECDITCDEVTGTCTHCIPQNPYAVDCTPHAREVSGPDDTAYCDNCNQNPTMTEPIATVAGGSVTVSATVLDNNVGDVTDDEVILIVRDDANGILCVSSPSPAGGGPLSCSYSPCVTKSVSVYGQEYNASGYPSCKKNTTIQTLSINCDCASTCDNDGTCDPDCETPSTCPDCPLCNPVADGTCDNFADCCDGIDPDCGACVPPLCNPVANGVCDNFADCCNGTDPDCGACPLCTNTCNNNGTCDTAGTNCENCATCPNDCGACPPNCTCGANGCQPACGENCRTCSKDCGPCIVDGVCVCGANGCEPACGENCRTCSQDCGSCRNCVCGNGACQPICGETSDNCPVDCPLCDKVRDFVCNSPVCCGIDPDCWCTIWPGHIHGINCSVGFVQKQLWDPFVAPGYNGAGACNPAIGKPCSTDSDCGNIDVLACDTTTGSCYLKDFIQITPKRIAVELGQQGMVYATIMDPVNRPGTYVIRFDSMSGESKYYSKFFGTESETTVSLEAGEVKRIPIYFTAASSGSFALDVVATDVNNEKLRAATSEEPSGNGGSTIQVSAVTPKSKGLTTYVSAPGLSALQILLIAMVIAVPFAFVVQINLNRARVNNKKGKK